eukprot:9190629-Alexandrium_andersonii.AAC.1
MAEEQLGLGRWLRRSPSSAVVARDRGPNGVLRAFPPRRPRARPPVAGPGPWRPPAPCRSLSA